jgi:DNA-binding XRE family transcriptional regulator
VYIVGKCRLNEILKEKRLSQVDLAYKVGMKKQQINAYANGESTMSLKTAKNIAYQLNISIDDLYDFIWVDQ